MAETRTIVVEVARSSSTGYVFSVELVGFAADGCGVCEKEERK